MEQKVENVIVSFNPTILDPNPQPKSILKKGKGSKNIFKVALFMMRGRSRKSKPILPVDDESKSIWRKLVGSMRPMHLQSSDSASPPQILNDHKLKNVVTENANNISVDQYYEDGFDSASEFPNSPGSSRFASAAGSRYASAVGLNEMVEEDEEIKEEEINVNEDHGDGDHMIDAKAEEFIAQFYQEMRLQRMDIVDHRYNEISMRSLGL
ncbi:uncharacterized protein [Cicer arietinum]|uniref:Uncharacterized protein LOC101509716 n=1 Tax=Cicer arietinum TaxID=3827 RepID=A0A1S2XX61_CICAR|nr:uncharacterized protein LOC101509716 [Cicer arietinum]